MQNLKNNWKIILLWISIGVFTIFAWYKWIEPDPQDAGVKQATVFNSAKTIHETVKGIDIASVQQALVTSQNQIKELVAQNDTLMKLMKEFKRVNSVTKINTITNIKDSIRFSEFIPCDFKPLHIKKSTPFYDMGFTVSKEQLLIDSVKVKDTIYIIDGARKTGLFNTTQELLVVHSNPYVNTGKIQSLIYKPKKKWYERGSTWFGIGAATATGIILFAK